MIATAVRSRIEQRPYRFAVIVALGAAFILLYGVLALGLVGEEGDPFDRIYAGVIGVGIVGALVARFRPEGMAIAMSATAFAMATVAGLALTAGKHESPATSIPELLGLHIMFIVLFAASALLFRRAADKQEPAGSATDG